MRKRDLWFYKARDPDGIVHLRSSMSLDRIPECSGAYIMGTSGSTRLIYPGGRSPIFYIGMTNNLRKRITTHFNQITKVATNDRWWVKRYEYANAFGATIAWYSVRGMQSEARLESELIDEFYMNYYSIPIANGAWPSGDRDLFEEEED